ncbi:hypothetical protein MMC21_003833 [Puttea exsequens]|nr:hypothetical protein [Puttea exsequens]
MDRFGNVLQQIKIDRISSMVTKIRRKNEMTQAMVWRRNVANQNSALGSDPTPPLTATTVNETPCKIVDEALCGTYNIVFHLLFDDGVRWVLKVPANGYRGAFNALARQALESEARTMQMIKRHTRVPLPQVHGFSGVMINDIHCPYILMDEVKGVPLWQLWWSNSVTIERREKVRCRALETIAAAMVEISQFSYNTSGSLQFDKSCRLQSIRDAKTPDPWSISGHEEFCGKAPSMIPLGYMTFMQERRQQFENDDVLDNGVSRLRRMLVEQGLKETTTGTATPFMLFHMDFNLQNIMVEDDGTLCGIIDWDRVSSVPQEIGCLSYPTWLLKDCDPEHYNYNPANGAPLREDDNTDDSPAQLQSYRRIYATLIESLFLKATHDIETSRKMSNLTRMSLIMSSLQRADDFPSLEKSIMYHMFDRILDSVCQSSLFNFRQDEPEEEARDKASATGVAIPPSSPLANAVEPKTITADADPMLGDTEKQIALNKEATADAETSIETCTAKEVWMALAEGLTSSHTSRDLNEVRTKSNQASGKGRLVKAFHKLGIQGHKSAGKFLRRKEIEAKASGTVPPPAVEPAENIPRKPLGKTGRVKRFFKALSCKKSKDMVVETPLLASHCERVDIHDGTAECIRKYAEQNMGGALDGNGLIADSMAAAEGSGRPGSKDPQLRVERQPQESKSNSSEPAELEDSIMPEPRLPEMTPSAADEKLKQQSRKSGEGSKALNDSGTSEVWDRIAQEVKNCGVRHATIQEYQRSIAAWIIDAMKEKQKQAEVANQFLGNVGNDMCKSSDSSSLSALPKCYKTAQPALEPVNTTRTPSPPMNQPPFVEPIKGLPPTKPSSIAGEDQGHVDEVEEGTGERDLNDLGHFDIHDICIALGQNTLDEARAEGLIKGFQLLCEKIKA